MSTALKDMIRNPTDAELSLVERYANLALDGRRERLFEAFAATGLPHRRLENWRWSDFKAAVKGGAAEPAEALNDPLAEEGVAVIGFGPGGVVLPSQAIDGMTIRAQADAMALAGAEDMPLGALAAALAGGKAQPAAVVVDVSAGAPQRLHIVHQGRGAFQAARMVFLLRPGAELVLTESHLGGAQLSAAMSEFTLQDGARLNRTIYQRGRAHEAQAITTRIDQDAAESVQTVLAFGAKVARIETHLVHREAGSKATLNAAYLAGAGYHADITTHVRHGAPDCVTRQATKGAVLDGGRGVFQGKFHVPRNAGQRTDASMQHNALLLEGGAEVFAKPELEILADDVQCAHGNTSGALDANQLFYLRQRGIPLTAARALLTEAFIAEALEEAGEAEAALRAEASAWLAI